MSSVPHGYTLLELFAASFFCLLAAVLIVVIASPWNRLAKLRDNMRLDDARNIMEAVIELKLEHPARFEELMRQSEGKKMVIGQAESCSGSFGSVCQNAEVADLCLPLSTYLSPAFLSEIPTDPQREKSDSVSGYYFLFEKNTLHIGACAPEKREKVEMTADFAALP